VTTWAIGDVQGCFDSLQALLARLGWRPGGDELWFVGDLVNRGPRSLDVLRWARKNDVCAVLGNHDVHLLARAEGARKASRGDTLDDVLRAKDCKKLIRWLRHRPVLHESSRDVLVHAGVPPRWNLKKARSRARAVEQVLRRKGAGALISAKPSAAPKDVRALAALTRMRFVDAKGRPAYAFKGPPDEGPDAQSPWFDQRIHHKRIVFGHWAALGLRVQEGVLGLDTGCVWGHSLTAVNLDTGDVVQQRAVEVSR
jgi:bis(5'-nucleosyl)-tetraphosphatase (symmetrical)